MKYSFMSFSCPELDFSALCEKAQELGYDGIELRLDSKHAHGVEIGCGDEFLAQVKSIAGQNSVEICAIASGCSFANEEITVNETDKAKKIIDLAEKLSVKVIRVFGGRFPETLIREQAIKNVSSALLCLSDYIGARDIKICMETHDSWCNPVDAAAVMKIVNRENIGINWDIMHPVLSGKREMREAFELLKPWIAHVHFHDGAFREGVVRDGVYTPGNLYFTPVGTGEVDHKTALECLKSIDYQGFLSGEWIDWNEPDYLRRELETMKKLEKSLH